MSWIQVLLLKPTKKVLKGNKKLEKYQEPEQYEQSNCIGFEIPNENEYYYDDDDYDE